MRRATAGLPQFAERFKRKNCFAGAAEIVTANGSIGASGLEPLIDWSGLAVTIAA